MTRTGKPKLRIAAQFTDRGIADEAWTLLMDEGIPSSLEHTPRSFGQGGYTRLSVADDDLQRSQRLLGELVARDQAT